jgi:hypothetical protein
MCTIYKILLLTTPSKPLGKFYQFKTSLLNPIMFMFPSYVPGPVPAGTRIPHHIFFVVGVVDIGFGTLV